MRPGIDGSNGGGEAKNSPNALVLQNLVLVKLQKIFILTPNKILDPPLRGSMALRLIKQKSLHPSSFDF